ncbi:MAG: hypothetical protein ACLQBX_18770 [Candidatus Limnocylindrales bacterium]
MRVEVGLDTDPRSPVRALGGRDVERAVAGVLTLPTQVFEGADGLVNARMYEQASRLARLYAYATSRRKGAHASREELDLVVSGRPMVVVEFGKDELRKLPRRAIVIEAAIRGPGVFAYYEHPTSQGTIPVWFVARGDAPYPALRSLRLCLLRLHAERECLDLVLAHIAARRLDYIAGSEGADARDRYLDDATQILEKRWSRGIHQSELVTAMNAVERVERPFATQALLDEIEGIRRQVRVKVERYVQERAAPRVTVEKGGIYMAGDAGIVAPGGNFYGTTVGKVIADQINSSFNTLASSTASSDVKEAVSTLKARVDELIPKLPGEGEKKQAARMFENLTREAATADPVESVVRGAGEAIAGFGSKVAELAGPIAAAVNGVLAALKFAAIIV